MSSEYNIYVDGSSEFNDLLQTNEININFIKVKIQENDEYNKLTDEIAQKAINKAKNKR